MLNVVALEGRLTKDITVKIYNGTQYCQISLAHEDYKHRVSYIAVKLMGKTAENAARYLSRGSRITVVGRIVQETWDDGPDGKKASRVCLYADRVEYQARKEFYEQNAMPNLSADSDGYIEEDLGGTQEKKS